MIYLRILSLLLMLSQVCAYGQLTVNDPSENESIFNPDIIKSEGIKSATAHFSIKYDLEKIRKTNKRSIYLFDERGFVKKMIDIFPRRNSEDSTVTIFFRNKEGLITTKVKTDNRITQVELLEYEEDKLVKHFFYQMGRTSKWNENLYNKFIIWADSLVDNDFGIGVYNRWDIMYKSYQLDRDENHNIIRFATYSRTKQLQQEKIFLYSDNRLVEISEENRNKYMFNWKKTFSYENGSINEIKYFKKGELQYVRKLHYKSDGLIELDLKRNEETKKMTIVKFEYKKY